MYVCTCFTARGSAGTSGPRGRLVAAGGRGRDLLHQGARDGRPAAVVRGVCQDTGPGKSGSEREGEEVGRQNDA